MTIPFQRRMLVSCVLVAGNFVACGGGNISSPPPQVSVSISPASANLPTGGSRQFTATVSGSANTAVTWQVNGVTGGDVVTGTITTGGLFAAPASVTATLTVAVMAVAQADPTKSASASVTITPVIGIVLSPGTVILAASGRQQFTATVTNTLNSAVTWQVNGVPGGNSALGTVSSAGLYTAPGSAIAVTITAVSNADLSKSASASVTVLPAHRIGTRGTSSGLAEFYDRSGGNTFVPRGNNYIRLAMLTEPNGNPFFGHSTFNVGLYDSSRSETALATMQAGGYNIVTVVLQGCCQNTIGDPAGGLSSAYIENVVDFLQRAKAHSIAVVFASQWLPSYGGYSEIMRPCYPQFDDINLQNLSSCGIKATITYYQDLVHGLISAQAPMDSIFGYELWDEYYYYATAAPLNATSGTITTANGQTYDMSRCHPSSR